MQQSKKILMKCGRDIFFILESFSWEFPDHLFVFLLHNYLLILKKNILNIYT
jgi:hypothetical protein